jgi:hypothetical protein
LARSKKFACVTSTEVHHYLTEEKHIVVSPKTCRNLLYSLISSGRRFERNSTSIEAERIHFTEEHYRIHMTTLGKIINVTRPWRVGNLDECIITSSKSQFQAVRVLKTSPKTTHYPLEKTVSCVPLIWADGTTTKPII